ncbi:MAG: TetR/AcrR family transcriptional regulator [Agriterribacter sp.]
MATKTKNADQVSAEEKIKEAARKVFTQKGYAATRTRDIAEEAGLNLALLNYYFRSKEKLFDIIMQEKMQQFFGIIAPAMNDVSTSLEKKVEAIVSTYIDMLQQNPDLPLFVLTEIRNNSDLFKKLQAGKLIQHSHFVQQLKERNPDLHPLHFIVSILGITIFPFVAKPVLQSVAGLNQQMFNELMVERKALIPKWIKAMLKVK